jgi:hypothetical protein
MSPSLSPSAGGPATEGRDPPTTSGGSELVRKRVRFSDTRICVTASPYVAGQSCLNAGEIVGGHPFAGRNCDLHHTAR